MDDFLPGIDELSIHINEQAKLLYEMNRKLPIEKLQLPGISDYYFKKNHNARPFFSIQTAAVLLYRSIKYAGKPCSDLIVMDYGAGVGNLYILAKMIGCKMVIYNDIVPEMTAGAAVIAKALGVDIDLYITADHKQTLATLAAQNIQCDIILSRNVIEHIYDLTDFFQDMVNAQPNAILYSSTTANFHNPVNRWYHRYLHWKFEKNDFGPRREERIRKWIPDIAASDFEKLLQATRGLAMEELDEAILKFKKDKQFPVLKAYQTNTCDPDNGIWVEQLLPIKKYQSIIAPMGYQIKVEPAFWDTHYAAAWKNILGKFLNFVTKKLGNTKGLWTTAFIYIIVDKKNNYA